MDGLIWTSHVQKQKKEQISLDLNLDRAVTWGIISVLIHRATGTTFVTIYLKTRESVNA